MKSTFNRFMALLGDIKGVHVALVVLSVLTFMAPTMKEKMLSLFNSSHCTAALEGDGILVGDTGSSKYVPRWWSSSINWKITQQPGFGDANHRVSIFIVPEEVAHRYLYRFHSHYTSPTIHVDDGMEPKLQPMQHMPITTNIYLLPKEYTRRGREARANLTLNVINNDSSSSEYRSYSVCRFQNRANYEDYIDMDRSGDECTYYNILSAGENKDEFVTFVSPLSSYNFFSAAVPTNSYVQYKTNIVMYFYNHTKLAKFYQCMIRGMDTCTFTTTQSWWKVQRYLIIAYTHPTRVPSSLTTKISVEANTGVLKNSAHLLLCVLIPSLLIRLLCYFC
jgi:hypothetical protein